MVKENDLVQLRFEIKKAGHEPYSNAWFRVMFIDNDGTFIGKLERCEWHFDLYKKGEDVKLNTAEIQGVYKGGQFCYGDTVTICDCRGLCRNK